MQYLSLKVFPDRCLASKIRTGGSLPGFTLIELLVVISIMSVLAAISFPVFTRANRNGDRVKCLSNQKQLYYTWSIYTMDNNGELFSANTQFNERPEDHNWVCYGPVPFYFPIPPDRNEIANTMKAYEGGVGLVIYLGDPNIVETRCGAIWPYIENIDVFKCPSDPSRRLRGYSISAAMHGEKNSYDNFDRIVSSGSKIVFIDGVAQLKLCSDGKMRAFWLDGPFSTTYDQLTARHEKGCNTIFADGHAMYKRWSENRTVDFINGGGIERDLSDDNPDFQWLDNAIKLK